jgi:hypothetical protein
LLSHGGNDTSQLHQLRALNIKNAMSVQMREGLNMRNIKWQEGMDKLQVAKVEKNATKGE